MGRYRTVVIDPPWRITAMGPNSRPVGGRIQRRLRYATMTDREIAAFPIGRFAAPECALFVWAIQSRLPFAIGLARGWGFRYYCTLTWVKGGGITMQGVHRNSEFAVFAYRGRFPLRFSGRAMPAAFAAKTGDHSEKPGGFYEMVRRKTRPPRIDLFARGRHAGFDAWGDEAAGRGRSQARPAMQG